MPFTTDHLRQHRNSLGVHLRQCRTLSDLAQRALCSLEAIDAAVGERMFTTVVVGSLLTAVVLALLV